MNKHSVFKYCDILSVKGHENVQVCAQAEYKDKNEVEQTDIKRRICII